MAKPMRTKVKEGLCGRTMSYCISNMQGVMGDDRPDHGLVLLVLRIGLGGKGEAKNSRNPQVL